MCGGSCTCDDVIDYQSRSETLIIRQIASEDVVWSARQRKSMLIRESLTGNACKLRLFGLSGE